MTLKSQSLHGDHPFAPLEISILWSFLVRYVVVIVSWEGRREGRRREKEEMRSEGRR